MSMSGAIDYSRYAIRGAYILMEGLAWKHTPTALRVLCPALKGDPGGFFVASVDPWNFGVSQFSGSL